MEQRGSEQSLISVEQIENINPLRRLPAENFFEPGIKTSKRYVMYETYETVARMTLPAKGFIFSDSPHFEESQEAERRVNRIFTAMAHKFKPFSDETGSGLIRKGHTKVIDKIAAIKGRIDKIDGEEGEQLQQSIDTTMAIFHLRSANKAQELMEEMNAFIPQLREVQPWVIAHREGSGSQYYIAARLVGFQPVVNELGHPLIEPIVLSGIQSERGLLPEGFVLEDKWLQFDDNTRLFED